VDSQSENAVADKLVVYRETAVIGLFLELAVEQFRRQVIKAAAADELERLATRDQIEAHR